MKENLSTLAKYIGIILLCSLYAYYESNAQCDTPCSDPIDWEVTNFLTTDVEKSGKDLVITTSRSSTLTFKENCYPYTNPYAEPNIKENPTYRIQVVKWSGSLPIPVWNAHKGFHCNLYNLNYTGKLSSSTTLIVNTTFAESSPSGTKFEIKDLEAGTYLICLRLGTDKAHSKYKLLSSVTIPEVPLSPKNVIATDDLCDKIRISWDKVEGALGYEIRDINNHIIKTGITDTYYNITDLINAPRGIVKTYKVRAANLAGSSGYGEDEGYRQKKLNSFFPIVTATDGIYKNKVRVSWTIDPSKGISTKDIDEFYIYRGSTYLGKVAGTATYFDDDKIDAPLTGVKYEVYAKNDCGISLPGHDPEGYRCPNYTFELDKFYAQSLKLVRTHSKYFEATLKTKGTVQFNGEVAISLHYKNGKHITDLDKQSVTLNPNQTITLQSDRNPVILPSGKYDIIVKYQDPNAYGNCGGWHTIHKQEIEIFNPKLPTDSRTTTAGDPVDMLTGSFLWGHNDIILKTIFGNIPFQRHYNSLAEYSSGFGKKWTHNFNIRLLVGSDYITLQNAQGKESYFFKNGIHFEPAHEASTDKLILLGSGYIRYVLEQENGQKYHFDSKGYLVKITYPNYSTSQAITLGYKSNPDGSRRLVNIFLPQGRSLFFSYDPSQKYITKIEDNASRAVLYFYDSQHRLIKSQNVRGYDTQYEYDNNNYMRRVIDSKKNVTVVNTYDAVGRVTEQRDAYSWDKPYVNSTKISYDTTNPQYAVITTFTNTLGYQTVYYHDLFFRLVKVENPKGLSRKIVYDGFSYRPKTIIDEDENEIAHYAYDAFGNLTYSKNALGGETWITLNSEHRPTLIKNSLGHSVFITYDSQFTQKPKFITYANGYTIEIGYYSLNGLPSYMKEGANIYTFTYTNRGDINEIATPTGSYVFGYDNNWGFVSSLRDRNLKTTYFEGDLYGNITKITDPMTYTIERNFDENGFMTAQKDKNGKWSYWKFDERNLLKKFIDANGNTAIELFRDDLGRVVSAKDAEEHNSYFEHNSLNQLKKVKNHFDTEIASYEYDNIGNRIKATFDTQSIDYKHNLLGQVVEASLEGKTYKASYNSFGMPKSFTDNKEQTTYLEYDKKMGWLKSVTDPEKGTVVYTRNLKGGIVNIEDAEKQNIKIERDPVTNLPILVEEPSHSGTTFKERFTYDNEGIPATYTNADDITATYTRNDNYEITGIDYSSGESENYTRDNNGWITQVSGTRGTINFGLDFVGNVTSVSTLGKTVAYGYDKVYNQTSVTYPSSSGTPKTVTTTFNELNLPTKTQDWLGNFADFGYSPDFRFLTSIAYSNGVSNVREYDSEKRLKEYTNIDAHKELISKNILGYDANNQIIANTPDFSLSADFPKVGGKIDYARDADGRLKQFGTENYSHNQRGARTATTGTKTEDYTWTADGFLQSYTKDEVTTTNTFDVLGNRIKKKVGTTETNYVLDINGLTQVLQERDNSDNIEASNIFTPFGLGWRLDENEEASFFSFDYKGNTLALTNSSGLITDRYASDMFGAYSKHEGKSKQSFTFLGKYGVQKMPKTSIMYVPDT